MNVAKFLGDNLNLQVANISMKSTIITTNGKNLLTLKIVIGNLTRVNFNFSSLIEYYYL